MWWKKYSFLLMYPMAVFGVVGSSYYASGHLNTFDKWYLIVFVPLGLWQWIEAFVRWRRERRTPPEVDVYPPQKAPAAPAVSSRSLFACTWRRLSPEASPIKR